MCFSCLKTYFYIKYVFTISAFAVCPHFRSSARTKVQVKINKTVYTLHVDSVQLTLQISALKLKTYMAVTMKMNTKRIEHIIGTKIYRFIYIRSRFYVLVWHKTTYHLTSGNHPFFNISCNKDLKKL